MADTATNESAGTPTRSRRTLVETEILRAAARVFDDKGIGTAGLQDVADYLDTSRPSIYHYFKSKDALLERLVSDLLDSVERSLDAALSADPTGLSAEGRLRLIVSALIAPIIELPGRFRIHMSPEAAPTEQLAARRTETHRRIRRTLQAVVAEGVDSGEFRRVSVRVATFSILGSVNWIAWWYRPKDDAAPSEVSAELIDLAVASLVRSGDRGVTTGDLLNGIREQLDHLEEIIDLRVE